VRSNVRRYARERQLSQTPTARGDYEPEMLLGVSQAACPTAPQAPSMLGTRSSSRTWTTSISMWTARDRQAVEEQAADAAELAERPSRIPRRARRLRARAQGSDDRAGQEVTVSLRIRYVRQVKKPARH
jgi:hypothetical protein